jgi:transcriptional regulator with XRE-family HTH domain
MLPQSATARQLLAKNLREKRVLAGLSQEGFAAVCGLHRTYISDIERGARNVSVDNLEKIALALGCPIGALFHE